VQILGGPAAVSGKRLTKKPLFNTPGQPNGAKGQDSFSNIYLLFSAGGILSAGWEGG
jgi:hypothetical protein